MRAGSTLGVVLGAALVACGGAASAPAGDARLHAATAPPSAPDTVTTDPVERALDDVARVHGAPGPWAVAGYRMAQHALAALGLSPGSFDLEVVHESPREVQFSCVADGASAYSRASVGKLNLALVEVPEADMVTVYRNKKTGQAIALRPSAAFRARYLNADTSHGKARALGREVMTLPDADVFEVVPVPANAADAAKAR